MPAARPSRRRSPPSELNPGGRCDISRITAGRVERTQAAVIARGMNDNQFATNPLVTLQHVYNLPPVGKSLWRKRVKDGDLVGIKAKTQYPAKPESWASGDPWVPDNVLALVQAGLLNGKSIGFLPLKVHLAEAKSIGKNQFFSRNFDHRRMAPSEVRRLLPRRQPERPGRERQHGRPPPARRLPPGDGRGPVPHCPETRRAGRRPLHVAQPQRASPRPTGAHRPSLADIYPPFSPS